MDENVSKCPKLCGLEQNSQSFIQSVYSPRSVEALCVQNRGLTAAERRGCTRRLEKYPDNSQFAYKRTPIEFKK